MAAIFKFKCGWRCGWKNGTYCIFFEVSTPKL